MAAYGISWPSGMRGNLNNSPSQGTCAIQRRADRAASCGGAVRHLAGLRALARDVDDLEFHRVVDQKTAGAERLEAIQLAK